MSTVAPVKFRCSACQKLLGASRSRMGTAVVCPRCGAKLVVPSSSGSPSPSSSNVEPVVILWDSIPEPDTSAEEETAFPVVLTEPLSLRPEPAFRSKPSLSALPTPAAAGPPPLSLRSEPSPNLDLNFATKPPEPARLATAAEIPAVTLPELRSGPSRRSDVTIPRTVVVLWSLLVLLAVVMAFAVGLLAGRFLWSPLARSAPTVVAAPK